MVSNLLTKSEHSFVFSEGLPAGVSAEVFVTGWVRHPSAARRVAVYTKRAGQGAAFPLGAVANEIICPVNLLMKCQWP